MGRNLQIFKLHKIGSFFGRFISPFSLFFIKNYWLTEFDPSHIKIDLLKKPSIFEPKLERASNFMVLLYSYCYVSFYLFQFFVCFIVGLFDFCRQILSLNTKAQLLVV